MNNISNSESNDELERKVRGIALAHLYLKRREGKDKISIEELEDRVSSLDQSLLRVNLTKLWDHSNWVEIVDSYYFSITDEGMAEEEKRIQEKRLY